MDFFVSDVFIYLGCPIGSKTFYRFIILYVDVALSMVMLRIYIPGTSASASNLTDGSFRCTTS